MQLYDGVTIPPDGNFPSMTGVIVYKKDDTIGVRLTGDSEGMGDHSGSVDGVDYFDGGVNSGVMTTISKVEPRKLTIAEEGLIRSLLQPKPAYSTPMASSVPISGLSPAALARMMQLNQRMGITPTNGAPKNKLPPSATTPATPPTPQLSDPPTVTNSEPPLEEEKPAEKRLSRLEILRQKKEAIRKRKLELERKVETTKKEKLQQQEDKPEEDKPEEATEPQQPMATEDFPETKDSPETSSSPKSTSSQKSTSSPKTSTSVSQAAVIRNTSEASMADEAASVKSKESSAMLSKASRSSRDSIEELWIHELRHETPASADKYDLEDAENLLLEEDEMEDNAPESNRSLDMRSILRQPTLQVEGTPAVDLSKSEGQDMEQEEEEDNGRQPPMRQSSMSRLQQLRQKKRLLEALPSSIQTPASAGLSKSDHTNLASMAMASAAALGHSHHNAATFPDRPMAQSDDDDDDDDDDSKTTASALSHMEDGGNEDDDAVPAAFQESVSITASSTNVLPGDVEETTPVSSSHKRRRMLGLGFLPGSNRQQKRQNTGAGRQ
ncbi:unnamed protein product [Cylindrotheca closterium]|uniref:CAP-Gly domain-containing protein n=1 Tax=Cylindrotheca closterium TaxID=2856 RepID=A0AAD2CL12_9STRA|nr:unnamed protein product [Cylindrotheca closterium]